MADEKQNTVTTTDREGNEFETEVGVDGENPVSVNNPPAKAISTDDAEVVKEELQKEEERYTDHVGEGSDGPGNDLNAETGTASAADLRTGRSRPTTAAGTGQPGEQDSSSSDSDSGDAEASAPAKSASKADWVNYAVNVKQDMTQEEAEAATRDELAAKYSA